MKTFLFTHKTHTHTHTHPFLHLRTFQNIHSLIIHPYTPHLPLSFTHSPIATSLPPLSTCHPHPNPTLPIVHHPLTHTPSSLSLHVFSPSLHPVLQNLLGLSRCVDSVAITVTDIDAEVVAL